MRPYHIISFPEGYSSKVVDDGVMIDLPPYKPDNLPETKQKHKGLIKEKGRKRREGKKKKKGNGK